MFQTLYSRLRQLARTAPGRLLLAVILLVAAWQIISSPMVAGPLGNLLLGGVVPGSGTVLTPMQVWQGELVMLLIGGLAVLSVIRRKRLRQQPAVPARPAHSRRTSGGPAVVPMRHLLRRPSTSAVDYHVIERFTAAGDHLAGQIGAIGGQGGFVLRRGIVFAVYAVVDSSVWAGIYLSLAVRRLERGLRRAVNRALPHLHRFDSYLERRLKAVLDSGRRRLGRSEHMQVLSDILKDISASLPSGRSHK